MYEKVNFKVFSSLKKMGNALMFLYDFSGCKHEEWKAYRETIHDLAYREVICTNIKIEDIDGTGTSTKIRKITTTDSEFINYLKYRMNSRNFYRIDDRNILVRFYNGAKFKSPLWKKSHPDQINFPIEKYNLSSN